MDGSWIHIRAEETGGWNGSWITSLARCRLWVTGLLCGAHSGKPAAAETARRRAPSGRQDEEIRDQPSRLQMKEKKMSSRYRLLASASVTLRNQSHGPRALAHLVYFTIFCWALVCICTTSWAPLPPGPWAAAPPPMPQGRPCRCLPPWSPPPSPPTPPPWA